MNFSAAIRPIAWLVVAGSMICASPVRASTVINGGSGSIDAHTGIGNPETQCVCTTQKSIELPPDPPTMSSDTADCSSCSANGVTVGTAHVDAGFSGNSQFLSYTAHGHGDPSSDHAVLLIDSFSASSITFTISGQAEVIQIAASLTISASGGAQGQASGDGEIQLSGPNGVIGTIDADENGTTGSIPSAPLLPPGTYTISVFVDGASDGFGTYNFTAMVSVNTAAVTDVHWTNPNGGNFAATTNWNPPQVPGTSDNAIFDLASAYSVSFNSVSAHQIQVSKGAVSFIGGQISAIGAPGPSLFIGGADASSLEVKSGSLTSISGLIDGPLGTSLSVTGPGSQLTEDTQSLPLALKVPLVIGSRQRAALNVTGGGSIDNDFGTIIGEFSGSSAIALVQGHDNSAHSSQFLSPVMKIGDGGIGELDVQGGAFVDFEQLDLGSTNTGHGILNLRGPGTKLHMENPADLRVGLAGQGQVNVSDGALVELNGSTGLAIGTDTNGAGDGSVHVTSNSAAPQPSKIAASGQFLRMGGKGGGSGLFEISNGAVAQSGFAQIGLNASIHPGGGLPATFIIDAAEATFDLSLGEGAEQDVLNQIGFVIGEDGALEIKNGGKLTTITGAFAGFTAGQGFVAIHDAGSQWTSDTVSIATDFPAVLRVTDEGAIEATDTFSVAGGGVAQVSNGGTIHSFNGEIGVPLFGIIPTFAGVSVVGAGSVWTTHFLTVGTSSAVPGSGFLQIDSGGKVVASTITVEKSGVVSGNGILNAGQRVINSGTISPGLSPGQIIIQGDYEQTADGILKMEAAGLNPGEFDVLHVTGNTTLGGTLDVRFLGGYLPKTGDVIPFLQLEGSVSGSFANVVFPQLAEGFQFSTEIINGKYQLKALNDAVPVPTSLINISTRENVGIGANVLIGGFILQGPDPKTILVRALGPTLTQFNVPGALQDPTLELHDSGGAIIGTNDNWATTQFGGVINAEQAGPIFSTSLAPPNNAESAILATLNPGKYTAIVRGINNTSGIALLEFYDVSEPVPTQLGNVSSRGLVEVGDKAMIGGFIIGDQTTKVIVRALGPTLSQFGVAGVLADPTLELRNGQGDLILANDNWNDTQEDDISATNFEPPNNAESAILATLPPGNYTAIVRGVNNTTGVALVEVYKLN